MELQSILQQFSILSSARDITVAQLKHEEDDALYSVWRIDADGTHYILKETTQTEADIHQRLLTGLGKSVPHIFETLVADDKTYLLMEYIEGEDLRKCNRRKLILALDALIAIQKETWEQPQGSAYGGSFEDSLHARRNRAKYLKDALLEKVYEQFLERYQNTPKAFCHDDLLPFNVLVAEDRAVLIDWEHSGFLPYPVSFARLIAHGKEAEGAFFYMSNADKDFAIDYYYQKLLKEKGISYTDWRRTLDYFLFYELCEWVYVGNRYDATDGAYYQKYLPLARAQAQKVLQPTTISNYDLMRNSMEAAFTAYAQEEIIHRFSLKHDNLFLYLRFVGQDYRICRKSGRIERQSDNNYIHASYNECAPILDLLTHTPRMLSGEFVSSNALPGIVIGASPDASVFNDSKRQFAGRGEALKRALARLGGQPCSVGDVSAIIPMFDFFPVMVQFWDADEEFDAVLKLMWDRNATSFMRYESIAIAGGHLIRRLLECM